MATIVLSTVGAAAGGATPLGPIGAELGLQLGSVLGGTIDDQIFGVAGRKITGPRLSDLSVQVSSYGKMIPIVYGTVRIAGNVIWSKPIKETAVTTSASSGGKGGGSAKQSQTNFTYSVTMAVAICEGPIDDILRIWADSKVIDPTQYSLTYRLYKGDESQLPDPTMESFEGIGKTPAYRGLCYIVVEDFPLGDFGNRIPNFTFEVKKRALYSTGTVTPVEDLVKEMVVIPGTGEFVYDTIVQSKVPGEQAGSNWVQNGDKARINQNNRSNKGDALVSLDQLQETCRNLEWVSVVVAWFGDSTNAGTISIKPGVEFDAGATTEPDLWQVGTLTRSTAYLISQDVNGRPVYGGTPDDDGLLRYLDELKNRDLKILFYPVIMLDVAGKPWRGTITGSTTDVSDFFTKTDGYNAFITHYANLVKLKVDAFSIGSELIGITKVKDGSNNFPGVTGLVNLAASIKTIVGSGVKVTYAADWSEYHHTDGGWYNLDSLWASSNIDFIGIDAYFPLTDEPQSGYDEQELIDGWTSGEGYDWYYNDPARTIKVNLTPQYAWKNINWWWANSHVNPDSSTTAWTPQSKKIWFTEYGFPSVDGAANQPNVFYDPTSSQSAFPYHSKGRVDFRAQRAGISATEKKWFGSTMIERKFLWTWDARPYPFWPDLENIWSDGEQWRYGHWVQGKFGLSNLSAILLDLCEKSGLIDTDLDVTKLTELVDGYVLINQITGRLAIEQLQKAYFFDSVESDNVLKFIPRGGSSIASIPENDIIAENSGGTGELLVIERAQEIELPQKIDVSYISRTFDYLIGNQHSQRLTTSSIEQRTINLPIVINDQQAKNIADVSLFNSWLERNSYNFQLSFQYLKIEPTDIINVTVNGIAHRIRITQVYSGKPGLIKISGVAEDISIYDFYNPPGDTKPQTSTVPAISKTRLEILDLPAFPFDDPQKGILRFAALGTESNWKGAVIYRSDDGGSSYDQIIAVDEAGVIGNAVSVLANGSPYIFDEADKVTVLLTKGELESVSELAVLNGANVALLGNEIIQFRTATLIGTNKYELSGLLRGRLGTEYQTGSHITGEAFVLLDSRVAKKEMADVLIGLSRKYKPVSVGATLGSTSSQDFTYVANSLRPYSPVHITGSRDGSGNLTINWIRRTRIGGEWRDNVDVPLNEAGEKYEVDIMNGSNVIRTITGITSPAASYNSTQQVTDFGSAQSSVSVRIYQLSEIVGRGPAGIGVV